MGTKTCFVQKIIEDSDECMDGRAGMNKRSSRKQSETLSKNKVIYTIDFLSIAQIFTQRNLTRVLSAVV
jgi:hypothetical protein